MQKKIRVTPKKKKIMPAGRKTASFPVVGIGASAGGLEAYQELLKNLSDKPGMAIVFIMHLAPGHKSMLTELLARLTKMPVREIKNGMLLEVNRVYVIPPSTNVSIAGGKLKLNKMKNAGLKRMPIDWFFRSLAEEQGNRGIGVILSGTATDGTLGAEAIKAEGGIIFAQDEKTAKYGGMPQSAIAAGCVDFVLSPKKIAGELERIAKHPLISFAGPVKADESIITEDKGLESIFDILRSAKGLDFTHYKTPTISRRVSRRMVLLKLENLKGYIKFLRENKDEIEKLYEDLLLKVTSLFRDPKVFDTLKKQVLPAILKNKKKDQNIRMWVPGCSSGEEAYSIAICLFEVLGNKRSAFPVQIFATDVSESSINRARQGIYGKNIKNSITTERLKRFFTKTGNSYKVSKQLREMCIFSKQNVFSDPPFSNLDLISCRNLLIYLQTVLQKKVFHNFHYGLRPGGFLLLGNSEAAGGYSNLFKTLDRKQRIFVKKYLSVGPELESGQKYYPPKKLEIKEKTDIKKGKETDIESIIERIVLSEYAPCGVLIDSDMEVVSFRGHTGRYLESATGKPSLDIFKLAREGLFLPLRAVIYKARETKHTVKREADAVLYNGRRMRVKITVVPVESGPLKEEFFLVLFDEIARAAASKNLPKARGKSVKDEKYVESLQKELAETKEYLQTVIEEQESANEEVKTANEEILSSNEELQSTNEELETAKEELQSSNEELITTNEEMQNRNAEVSLLNNDLINLLSSINMPVVMMGTDLVIRRITPQAEKTLNVISSDIGRPISKIKLNVDIPDLEKILSDVIESLHPKTVEIKSREGNWYSVYIRPYRTLDNKINGVVAIFIDITEHKKAQQIIEEARAYAENILETMREPLIVLDTDLKVISANRSFYQTFKVNHKEAEGQLIYDLGNRQWDIPKLRQLLEEILPKNNTFDNYEIEHDFETIGLKTMLLNARRLATMQMILITIDDITERKQMERELERAKEEEFRVIFDNATDGILLADLENGKFYRGNKAICRMLGYSQEEIKNLSTMDIHPKKDLPRVISQFKRQTKGEITLVTDIPVKRKNGSIFYADVNSSPVTIAGKTYLMGSFRDITERKRIDEKTRRMEEIKTTTEIKTDFVSMVSHELRTPLTVIKEGIALVADGSTGEINEEQKEILDLLKKNVDRLAKLINDVLDFQKLEAGGIKLNAQPNDINKIVRDVYETMTLAAKDIGVELLLELDDRLPKVGFDNDKITQVLTNLVDNAMKFTEKGNIVIKTSKEEGMIHVSVSDTGCGIKKKDLSRVFGRFEQLSTGGERKTGGTGLGLAICKGIIEQHNGEIRVDSVFGKGSKFTFTLPIYNIKEPFRKYVNDGIKEASINDTKMSILLISISDFDKLKQKLSHEKITSTLKDMKALLEDSVRHSPHRADDAAFELSGEVFVVLANCSKENIPVVKERLEQKLDDYLSQQNLNDKVRLLFGCATYPDDANTDEDLIMKAKELHPIVSTALSV
jgi:two-component system CheB/CheR fusion protein